MQSNYAVNHTAPPPVKICFPSFQKFYILPPTMVNQNTMNKGLVSAFLLVLSLSISISFADYFDADASLYARNSTNVTVKGYIRMDNTSGVNNTNITGFLGNSNFTIFTNTSSNWQLGYFELNLTAPNSTGRYNVSMNATLTNGTVVRENIEIRIGHLANVTFNFTNRRPPSANGSY